MDNPDVTPASSEYYPEALKLHRRHWRVANLPYIVLLVFFIPISSFSIYLDRLEVNTEHHRYAALKTAFDPVAAKLMPPQGSAVEITDAAENYASRALCDAFVILNGVVCIAGVFLALGIWREVNKAYLSSKQRKDVIGQRRATRWFGVVAFLGGLLNLSLGVGTVEPLFREAMRKQGWRYVPVFMSFWDFVSIVTVMSLVTAIQSILLPPADDISERAQARMRAQPTTGEGTRWMQTCWLDEAALFYAERMHLLRTTLYIATAALVTNVLYISSAYHWLLAFVPGEHNLKTPLYKAVSDLISGVVTMRSVFSTVILAIIYLPAYGTLKYLARQLANEACSLPPAIGTAPALSAQPPDVPSAPNSFPSRDAWMKARGLASDQIWHQAPQLISILAPILAGPTAELLKGFTTLGGK